MPTIHGVNLSPFVRKVRVALAEKNIEYDLEPLIPINVPPEFKTKSPLGKIPVYEDGDFVLPDSSCIIAYLERIRPTPALYPADPQEFGQALFLEEYADTKLLEATLPFFRERIVGVKFMNRAVDEAVLDEARKAQAEIFPYLESRLDGGDGIIGVRFSIADIALASPFVNMQLAGESVGSDYPKLASYLATIHGRPSFKALIEEERAGLPA
jgi:glutathione S-transferase